MLAHDGRERALRSVANALIYQGHDHNTVGIRRGRLDIARRAVEAVRQWQAQASAEEKETPAWQRESSVSHNKLGDLAVAQGDVPGAMRRFTDALQIRERLAASDPANAKWQRDLWVSYVKLAGLSEKDGKPADAKGWWRKAHDTLASMKQRGLHLSPKDEESRSELRAKVSD